MSGSLSATIFTDQTAALSELRQDRLVTVASNYFPDVTLSDAYLWSKLMSAEAQASRSLRTFLTPRQVYATGADPTMVAALQGPTYEEPGYDYDSSMFFGGDWGSIDLRWRPVIAVNSVIFTYPMGNFVFNVPTQWLRTDKKYGRIQFVPLGMFTAGQLGSLVIASIGMSNVPLMLQVQYQAGLQNVWQDYPDIPDVVCKMAVLSIIEDQFLPGSASTSVDGLSQSLSWSAQQYQDQVEKKLARLRQSIQGIVMGVC